MIVVLEGPSAAGKTTSATRLAPDAVVAEAGHVDPPARPAEAIAQFWTDINSKRWRTALHVEATAGIAICDTDPLKLHYDFCLLRNGEIRVDQMHADHRAARDAMSERRLGIADLVVCEIPDPDVLERRRRNDPSRTRHRFDLHRRLAEPLREWYEALETLDPGRVQCRYPDALPAIADRDRYDLALFDAWMSELGVA